MTAYRNKHIICDIYNALESGDRSVFARHVAPDYSWEIKGRSSWCKRFEGAEEVRAKLLRPLFSRFETTYRARIVHVIAEGDLVSAQIEGEVITRSGDAYNNLYSIWFRFRNERIVEITEYCDTDLVERVLGPYEAALANASSID